MWFWLSVAVVLLVLALVIVAVAVKDARSSSKCCEKRRAHACVQQTFPVGVNPAGVALLDDCHALVANSNGYGLTGSSSVSAVNLKTGAETTILDASFVEPFTVTFDKKRHMAYVTNSGDLTISVIDTRTNTVVGVIGGFDGPSDAAIQGTGAAFLYVSNYGSAAGVGSGAGDTVTVVDLTTRTVVGAPITVPLAPQALVASPCGNFVYVVSYVDGLPGTGAFAVIDTTTNTVVSTTFGFSGPFDLALTTDGRHAYVTNFGSNNFWPYGTSVSVVELRTYTIAETISDLGIQPAGIAICGDYAYVTLYNSLNNGPTLAPGEGMVVVIDTTTRKVVGKHAVVGQSPGAVACNKHVVAVTNYTGNSLSLLT